eukprot:c10972_g1_i1 orf=175-831(+)
MSSVCVGTHSRPFENGLRGITVFNETNMEVSQLPITHNFNRKASQVEESLAWPLSTTHERKSLQREHFSEPSPQNKPNSPDFEHRHAPKSLCIHGCPNPSWVLKDPPKGGSQPTKTEEKEEEQENGELCLEKKKTETQLVMGIYCDTQEEDNDDNPIEITTKSQNDSAGIFAILASLKAFTKQRDLHRGSRIHADIVRMGLLEKNVLIGNTLINMYAK